MSKTTFSIDKKPTFNNPKELAFYYSHRNEQQVNEDISSNKQVYFSYVKNIEIDDLVTMDSFLETCVYPTLLFVDIRGTATTLYNQNTDRVLKMH